MTGFIPAEESQFTDWSDHFISTLRRDRVAYQLSEEDVDELFVEFTGYDTDYKKAIAARDAAAAAVQAKDDKRQELEAKIRSTAKRIQADDRVADSARKEAGLPIHKKTRKPVKAPVTAPVGSVMLTARLEQSLSFADSETRKRRPAGAIGVQIYMTVGDAVAPVDPADYTFVEQCSRGPRVFTFKADDANKVAHYLLRWVNHKGETGPWSAPVSGTIPAV